MNRILLILIVITTFGCANNKNCENAMCTALFAMVTVKLKDTTNASLSGVSTQTILLYSGKTIHTQSGPGNLPDSSFTVADDGDLKEIGLESNQNLEFKIFKNSKLLKTIPYSVKTDCCHISKASGPEEISIY